jgi:hypothetical protein
MSQAGIARSAVRYRRLGESVQEFVVLSPRASRGPSPKQPQRTGSLLHQWIRHRAGHPLVLVGVGMLVTVLLVLVSQVVVPWAMKTADDVRYGYPRTTQEDHYVGHEQGGTPSHFVAMNLQGQITVVELPGESQRGAVVGGTTVARAGSRPGSGETAVCGREQAPRSGGGGTKRAGALSQHGNLVSSYELMGRGRRSRGLVSTVGVLACKHGVR